MLIFISCCYGLACVIKMYVCLWIFIASVLSCFKFMGCRESRKLELRMNAILNTFRAEVCLLCKFLQCVGTVLVWSTVFQYFCLFTEGCLQPIYRWSIAGVMVLHYRFIWPQPGLEHLLNCPSPVAVKAKWSTGDDDASTQPGRAVVLTDWLDGWLAGWLLILASIMSPHEGIKRPACCCRWAQM